MIAHILCTTCGPVVNVEVITPTGIWRSFQKPVQDYFLFALRLGGELQLEVRDMVNPG